MIAHGVPEYIRSDNGPEFVAKELRKWLAKAGAKTLYIEPGSPWENGYRESFNSKMRDEFLNCEIMYSLKEARVLTERWRVHYNTERHTRRSVTGHRLRQCGRGRATRGMEKWKAKNASHFSIPPTTATGR